MTSAALPPDLGVLVAALDAATTELRGLAAGLSGDSFNWRPNGGRRWSVGQCVDHLACGNAIYLGALRPAAKAARSAGLGRTGPIALPLLERWFVAFLEPPPKFRSPAPKKIVPAERLAPEETLERFAATQREFGDFVRENADLDWNAAHFVNPFIPLWKPSLGMALHVTGAHERRHLLQVRGVLSAAGFPG